VIRTRRLEWIEQAGIRKPRELSEQDVQLHKNLDEFCKQQLREKPNLSDYADLIFVYDDKSLEILAVAGTQFPPDVPLFRVKPSPQAEKATARLIMRLNDVLSDRGLRGLEALIHVAANEPEEARCPNWAGWLKAMEATPANRWTVKIK
jgi:hypothetical protein